MIDQSLLHDPMTFGEEVDGGLGRIGGEIRFAGLRE
jgi:hypothetical protein